MIVKFLFIACCSFVVTHLFAQSDELQKLNKLKGTWMIVVPHTGKEVYNDTIITNLNWSLNHDTLQGKQKIISKNTTAFLNIFYTYNKQSKSFSYAEYSDTSAHIYSSPLIIQSDTLIYPYEYSEGSEIIHTRTLNLFNQSNTEIMYKIQKEVDGNWITTGSGKEIKVED